MSAAEFLNALAAASPNPVEARRRLDAMSVTELNELRSEMIRRLAAGELPPVTALTILPLAGVEPAVPDLVRLLRSAAPVPVRAAAVLLLRRHTSYDVERELETLDLQSLPALVEEALAMHAAAGIALQKGTPFERLALADREDDEADLEAIVDELIESFCASPEASAVEDREELRFWAGALVDLGVAHGHGSPALWDDGTIEEILTELLPRKVSIGSAAEAEGAVPAFRTFFRWVSRVAPLTYAKEIDAALEEHEADFPSMMMDQRRFGLAKSFVVNGNAAGFDMSTEEGLMAFAEHQNRQRPAVAAVSRKKMDAAKKRKAKMANSRERRTGGRGNGYTAADHGGSVNRSARELFDCELQHAVIEEAKLALACSGATRPKLKAGLEIGNVGRPAFTGEQPVDRSEKLHAER